MQSWRMPKLNGGSGGGDKTSCSWFTALPW
jgi:hypothetical protein